MHVIRAILLMIFSMALLALSDVFIKLSSNQAPRGQVMFLIAAIGTASFVVLSLMRGETPFSRDAFHPMVLLRCFFEIVAGVGIIFSLSLIEVTTFAAIMQTAPIIVTLGGALFLGEDVGWRRWAAVGAGLLGMLIVIRPGAAGFQPADLWAVLGVSALAARDLVTRLAPAHLSSLSLSTWGFGSVVPAGLVLMLLEGSAPLPATPVIPAILGAAFFTTTGYLAITTAMWMAPVSRVAPFRYTRLIFSTALGMAVFGERPDGPTILGASIILAAGLYTFYREHRLAKSA